MEKKNVVKENFPKLAKACQQYPTIQLHLNNRATVYKPVKIKAKDGFISKFCQH